MHVFFRKKYPPFWQDYLSFFKNKTNARFEEIRFVVFDTETTGLDVKKDKILSIGAIAITNKTIQVQDSFECFLQQDLFDKKTVKIHGIRKNGTHKISEKEAIKNFLGFIKNAVLVGHHINFDAEMINQTLSKYKLPRLKNTLLDTGNLHKKTLIDNPKKHFSLDALITLYKIVPHDRHNSMGDAFITSQIFLKILKKLAKNNTLSIRYLRKHTKRIGLI